MILRERMREQRDCDYKDAMRRYLAKKPFKFRWSDGRPTRSALHREIAE